MHTSLTDYSTAICDRIDWTRPELADTVFARAYRAGRREEAAMGFVRYLRERQFPRMGYSREYVARLRAQASAEFRREAERTIAGLLGTNFQGGKDAADGRGTLLGARPEVLQVGATRDDFLRYAENVLANREKWGHSAIHSLVFTLSYLQFVWPLEECPDEALLPLLGFMLAQMDSEWAWAQRWNEAMLGTQGHNWWVAQFGMGHWKDGLLFPEFTSFAQFQSFFPTYFEREMGLLMAPDGFTHEVSVHYHSGTIDAFLNSVRLAELNGLRFSREFHDRLRACYEVEWKLMAPDGGHPPFGDIWSQGPYYLNRARSVAALLGIPEAKYLAELLDPDWLSPFGDMLVESLHYPSVGEDLMPAYRALEARAPEMLDTTLPHSQYYVMRSGWDDGDYLAIEASGKGNLVTSHGHGAIFDVHLQSHGTPVLIGNGKGPCGSAEPERSWRVGCGSHNVATVDGEDHVPLRSVYRFGQVVLPSVDTWISHEKYAYFSGVHEAYERYEQKVPGSRRKLFYLRGEYWILIDRFTAASPDDAHTYRQRFQLGLPSRKEADSRVVTLGEQGNLLIVPVAGAAGVPEISSIPYPLDGYPSPDQLTYTQHTHGHGLFVSVLVPFAGDDSPQVDAALIDVQADGRTLSPWEATGVEIAINGRRDMYVDLHMQWNLPWVAEEYAGDSRLFHSRCR